MNGVCNLDMWRVAEAILEDKKEIVTVGRENYFYSMTPKFK